jgi:hypothetical protein
LNCDGGCVFFFLDRNPPGCFNQLRALNSAPAMIASSVDNHAHIEQTLSAQAQLEYCGIAIGARVSHGGVG